MAFGSRCLGIALHRRSVLLTLPCVVEPFRPPHPPAIMALDSSCGPDAVLSCHVELCCRIHSCVRHTPEEPYLPLFSGVKILLRQWSTQTHVSDTHIRVKSFGRLVHGCIRYTPSSHCPFIGCDGDSLPAEERTQC